MIPEWFVVAAAFVLGLIFGSFGTAFAYRVPRRESLGGRSKCPNCGHTITAAENIPVLSYVLLRGRCRNCGEKISIRYPLIELASGILFALAAWKFGLTMTTIAYAGLFWVLLVLSVIDMEYHLLPNRVVFPAIGVGAALLIADVLIHGRDPGRLVDAAVGALIFSGFLFVVAFIYPAGMGMGDVKLALLLGMFLGYQGGVPLTIVGMFLSFLLGGFLGAVIAVARGGGRKTQISFGEWLAMGTIVAVLFGESLLDWYLSLF